MHSHLVILGLLLSSVAHAQLSGASETRADTATAPKPTLNHSLVFLDPAHGGDDPGARLLTHAGEQLAEKDVTLAFGSRIRSSLSAFGLTVLTTREPDPLAAPPAASPVSNSRPASDSRNAPDLRPDARAGLANHLHPFACLILHATGTGSGVHLILSGLPRDAAPDAAGTGLVPWDSAQAPFLEASDRLASGLATSIARTGGIPVHLSHADIRPLDSLTCPAVLVELAPLPGTSVADPGYQARVAQAISTALLFWRGHAEPGPGATTASQP